MLNFLMTCNEDCWEHSPTFFPKDRLLNEYMPPDLREKYSELSQGNIEELKKIPCVFCYENPRKKDAVIGNITNVIMQQNNVRIDFTLTGEKIKFEDFTQLSDLLDMGSWEWNRTHWTLKQASIEDLRPYFASCNELAPKVFVSYSWNPPSNQKNVFTLISELEADGIHAIYDKKNLHPGQDMNFFMEQSLNSDEIDAVIIVCNAEYAKKANSRQGGVGYESELILNEIKNKPLQERYIPIVLERDENGEMSIPNFLKSRYCIDLTSENGYHELKNAIIRVSREVK